MAINFLDNIQLNQNQLLGARLENVTSDPGSALGGDIIFNSTSNILKYYNGTGWISLTEDTGVAGSGTANTVAMFTASDTIGDSIYTQNGGATEAKIVGGIFVTGSFKDSGGDLGNNGQLLSSTGTATNWINAPVSYTKWIADGGSGTTQDVNDGDSYFIGESTTNPGVRSGTTSKSGTTITQDILLTTKSMTVASPSAYSTDVILWGTNTDPWKVQQSHIEDVPVSAWGDATSTVDMGSQKIIDLADPTVAQDAATKAYVDSAVEGGLNVKGGFNAATGAITGGGNLTVGGSRVAIAVGDYYVVTVAGNFFANAATPLTPGDSVLVQTAAAAGASIEDDFAVIQSDTDLATASTVGIGNVNASTANNNEGLSLSYSNGTGTVGLDIKGALSAATAVADDDRFAMFQGSAEAQGNFSITSQLMADYFRSKNSFAGTSASGTSHAFTHNLNSSDVIVQVYDASTLETVYANVDRNTVNQVTVTTTATANIRCLIQKVG